MTHSPASPAKIRAAVQDSGYSQLYIARQLGVSDVAVYRWVNGIRKPSRENLASLARVLHVAIEDLKHDELVSSP